MATINFQRYLAAKKSVDDRALNLHVWETLAKELPASSYEQPVRMLEAGAGTGAMLERILEWSPLAYLEYTLLDEQVENIQAGVERLLNWAGRHAYQASLSGDSLLLERPDRRALVSLVADDLFNFVPAMQNYARWDVLIASAFLDLVDIPSTLPQLFSLLEPGGLFYFTINFDGATIFEPEVDPEYDDLVPALYHRSMDERLIAGRRSGDSRSGRRLFQALRHAGADILNSGASDWVVFPHQRQYPADEAYFLHCILHFIQASLENHPALDARRFQHWLERRRQQVEQADLVYIAHQLDFTGRYLGAP